MEENLYTKEYALNPKVIAELMELHSKHNLPLDISVKETICTIQRVEITLDRSDRKCLEWAIDKASELAFNYSSRDDYDN